jgi:hypothetical protein
VILIGGEGSGSLDQSEIFFPRSSNSGGGRVSSICASVVIFRELIALESDSITFEFVFSIFFYSWLLYDQPIYIKNKLLITF